VTSTEDRLPLLRARPSDIASRVLMVGDPGRAEQAAGRLTGASRVAANREYETWTGQYEGRRVTVCSHGVGSAGAGVCFEEVARAGAKTVVRAGTCGALRDEISDGDLVVAIGAARDEGLTPRLVPIEYPAVCDPEVVGALRESAGVCQSRVHHGVVLTSDLFYPSKAMGQDWAPWQEAGAVVVEMELSALLIGQRAGGIFVVDGNPTKSAQDMSQYDPYRTVVSQAVEEMLDAALRALISA